MEGGKSSNNVFWCHSLCVLSHFSRIHRSRGLFATLTTRYTDHPESDLIVFTWHSIWHCGPGHGGAQPYAVCQSQSRETAGLSTQRQPWEHMTADLRRGSRSLPRPRIAQGGVSAGAGFRKAMFSYLSTVPSGVWPFDLIASDSGFILFKTANHGRDPCARSSERRVLLPILVNGPASWVP